MHRIQRGQKNYATTESSVNRIKACQRNSFLIRQIELANQKLGVKYSMRDLMCDVNYCA